MTHKTYIRDTQNGDTAILFIHGFLGSPKHFEAFFSCIPKNYAIYNILLDGHGKTVRDFGNTSMEKWKKQVDDTVNAILKKYSKIIIMAHSMGTFFAMDESFKHPENIKGIFLLGSAIRICVKPDALVNTFKAFFDKVEKDDYIAEAYKNSHSVTLDKRIWLYAKWIPRYLELFRESRTARTKIENVTVPCYFFQSANDELVSIRSVKDIPHKENISVQILKTSRHFIYSKEDFKIVFDAFSEFLNK